MNSEKFITQQLQDGEMLQWHIVDYRKKVSGEVGYCSKCGEFCLAQQCILRKEPIKCKNGHICLDYEPFAYSYRKLIK